MKNSALDMRAVLERGHNDPARFRRALDSVGVSERDGWVDLALGLGEPPEDGPELPRGCVPYLPCGVGTLLEAVDRAPIAPSDVFVDVGSGVGRATALVHLLTGARAIGLEVQPHLADAARELAARLGLANVTTVVGDAATLASAVTAGSVFFLYCPFSGEKVTRWLTTLEPLARTRTLRICCVDMPPPACAWLLADPVRSPSLRVYRSTKLA